MKRATPGARGLMGGRLAIHLAAGHLAASIVAGSLLAMSGCASSPEPQFYALFASRGGNFVSGPLQIQLRRPGLPGYLDRPQIVRQEQPGELELAGGERWGAPLEDMVGSILAQNLAERLPKARVFTESGGISSVPDAQLEVDIQRFELTGRGAVELVAQVAVHWPQALSAERLDRYAFSRVPKDRSTLQLVAQMSGLLADLADGIARSIAESKLESRAEVESGAEPRGDGAAASSPPSSASEPAPASEPVEEEPPKR